MLPNPSTTSSRKPALVHWTASLYQRLFPGIQNILKQPLQIVLATWSSPDDRLPLSRGYSLACIRAINRDASEREKKAKGWSKTTTLTGSDGISSEQPAHATSKVHANPSAPSGSSGCALKDPYLLRGKRIMFPNQVRSTDIIYIPLGRSHVYLSGIINWHSRYIVDWRLNNMLKTRECVACMEAAFEEHSVPAITNSDQGSTYTSDLYVACLASRDCA